MRKITLWHSCLSQPKTQLYLLFEYIEHKYLRTFSCPSIIRIPNLTSKQTSK